MQCGVEDRALVSYILILWKCCVCRVSLRLSMDHHPQGVAHPFQRLVSPIDAASSSAANEVSRASARENFRAGSY
jgi:hypothetical protein